MDKTATTLPTAQQSDTRMDEFWNSLDASLATPAPAPRNLDVGLSDVARAVGAGGLELVGGIGELARQAGNYGRQNGGKDQGDYLENARANLAKKLAPALDVVAGAGGLAQSGADSLKEGMSVDAREAMTRSLVSESPSGSITLGDGAGDIDVWAMKMAQGMGSLLPTLASGGITGLAAKATIGRMVTASMIKRGAAQEVAEAVAAKTVSRLATGAATTTGVTGSVGAAGVNARDSVLGMSFDELRNSTTFRDTFLRIDADQQTAHLSDSEKLQLAREETANVASQATMGDAKTWGAAAVGTLMGDTMLFKMLAGKGAGGGLLKGMGKGAAGEGISEALEEGAQQYSVNEALNEVAGVNIDPMKGVVSSAIEGGLIGMGVGGATGGVGGLRGERGEVEIEDQQVRDAEPTAQEPTPDEKGEPQLTPEPAAPTATDQSPLGPSTSQFDELRDVPAYLRQDDTADRFKGLAQDSEVQRALAGEFGSSVQELVSAQMQNGNQGKSLYERVQGGELGEDPFAGGKSALQVAVEGQRPALPLKDVIFAGDANAKPKGEEVAAPGDHDDPQAGPGPQFRGSERTRWQSGQEGDLLPADRDQMQSTDALPGATLEGEGREIGTELPYRDVIYGSNQRQPDAAPMRGNVPVSIETNPVIGPLKSLRVTRKGKPFASEKEAQLASRKGLETPVPLDGGGFGVAGIAEVERVKAGQPNNRQPQQLTPAVDTGYSDIIPSSEQPEVTHDQPARIPASSSEGQGDQPGAGSQTAADAKPSTAELASRAGARDRGDLASPVPASTGQQQDDKTLTTPAPAGVEVSEPVAQVEAARAEVNTEPTQAQKEAGNYKKGHLKLHGFDIALENPKGSTRSGTAPDGKAWQSTMAHDYGYIKRTEGADGDHVDVFIGDQMDSESVFVVDQVDPKTGKFDEHKVMMGFADEQAAREGYLANYEPGWKGLGAIKAMPVKAFKRWLKEGDTTKSISRAKHVAQESITDFGEKIGGARKDVWASYRDSIQGDTVDEIKELPLSKAWPTPDYQKLLDSGIQPWFVAYARAARDSIPAKPQTGWKQQRWAEAVKAMRDTALGLLEGDSSSEQLRQQIAKSGLHLAEDISNRAALYEAVGHQRSLADLKLRGGEYSLYNGVKYDPPKQMWTLERGTKSSALGNWPRIIATGDSKQEAIAAFKVRYEELTAEASKPKAVTFDIYSRDDGKGWFVGKKLGRNYLDLTPAFKDVKEARAYRAEHQDELIAKLEQHKAIPRERRDLNQPRVGEDMRAGQDVTPEQFASSFGFRGVEFGNWVEQGRRQRNLNDAFDALMDMAAILGIPPKAISLNGELGLAFGARGSGGVSPAAAHYEPGKMVINLTKMNGAGSLGHEWWHALDNYFSRLRGKAGDNMTEALDVDLAARGSNFVHKGEVRKEMVVAFGAVMRAIKQTTLRARSSKLDSKRTKQYWTTNTEMSARAFESYLISKLQDQGASNDYLANIVDEATWEVSAKLGWELDDSYPYPTAGEVPGIRAGFDHLFSALEMKQEGERVILFSKQAMAQGDKPAKHLTRAEAELVTKMWFQQYKGASGIDVRIHTTQGELEQVLGLESREGLIRRAAFDDDSGALHVAADTIADPKRMREILRHEVLAHYGLANVLGDGEYTKLMSRLIQSQKDPSMKGVWDWVNTHYAEEDIGTQAEEVVAHLAELEQSAWGRSWDRVVAWVTQALRAIGFVPDGITAAETRSLIEGLGKKLQRTGTDENGPDGGKKFSQEEARPTKKGGIKMSQASTAADSAMGKLNLGPKPDIIDKTKTNLNKLRQVDRGVISLWIDRVIKKANTEVLDALAPIKYAEEAAGITEAADSGYVAARMATGAASTMQATMLYGLPEWKDGVIQRKAGTSEKDALLGIFSDLGKDLHNWLGWMAGHRAEILMGQGRENLLSEQDIAALKGLGNGKEAKFMEAKERWNRLNTATLNLAQEAGLFTAEARAEFESEWYIPFFRESDDGDVIAPFKPKGIANQSAGIKKLKGGEANTNDLLENIFTSTSKLIDASMKNMAAQKTVWNLADTGLIEVVAKPNMMDWRALKNGKDLITVKLEGEDYMIRIEDPDLYRAMTFFDRQPFGAMVNMAAKAKRLLTAGVTASPEFMLRNFLRDSLSSWAISKDGFKPVIDSIKGMKKSLVMDGSTIDVMFSGASFLGGYVNGNDPGAMADTVRKSLRRKGMTPEQITRYEKTIIRNAAHAKGVVADVWEKYSRYGEALENGNREAVYDAAIKAGKSHAQAAFESKDLMDFSMLGAARAVQGAAMVLPFFNARLQGLGKLTRELRDNPREIAKRAGAITAMSLGLLALNWDDERYEELPDWDKDANWHFWIGEQHWRIPKPFEIGVMFGTIPERMVRALGDKDTGAQFGKAVARAIGDTFALNPTPQIVKPMVEAAFNYDSFRGGPIDGPQDLAVQAEARYNEQTSLLMRELGELSGLSPKQLEHLVIGYTGTIGSYVMAAADGLIRGAQPGESASWRADEIPLVKAVYRGTGPAKSTQHMEEFYRMLNEVNQLKRTVNQYRSEGLTDKANELLEEQGGILKSRRSLSSTQQQVRVVRNKIELIQRDRTMTAGEKRRRIDELLDRRNGLVYQAVNHNRQNWE